MLDSGGSGESKAKKSKPVTRPTQRFWPEAIANIQPQLPAHLLHKPTATSLASSPPSSADLLTAGGSSSSSD